MTKTFVVRDKTGRTWGSFSAADKSAPDELHGYLIPEKDFELVRRVFQAHDVAMAEGGDAAIKTAKEIIALGAYLVDKESGERLDLAGVIFISDDLLLSCRLAD